MTERPSLPPANLRTQLTRMIGETITVTTIAPARHIGVLIHVADDMLVLTTNLAQQVIIPLRSIDSVQ